MVVVGGPMVEPGVVWVGGGVLGVAAPLGGVAAPGVEVCPAVPALPAGGAAGVLCANTQVALLSKTNIIVTLSFIRTLRFEFTFATGLVDCTLC